MTPITRFFCCCGVLSLAALTLPAGAQDSKAYGPGVLRPDQVKQCVADRNEVVALNTQLRQEKDRLTQDAAGIERVEAGLVRQQGEISVAREELVRLKAATKSNNLDSHLQASKAFKLKQEAFNVQVRTYNEGVTEQQKNRDRYNAAVLDLNARLDQLRNRANEVDGRCASGRAYQDDIRSAKEALGEGPAPQP